MLKLLHLPIRLPPRSYLINYHNNSQTYSFEKRHKNVSVHLSPAFENVKPGDVITAGQCRPLSKTVRFNAVEHQVATNDSLNVKKTFRMF